MSEWRQRKMATFLSIFYNVPENRTQETEERRTFSSVSLLCTVISKSSRPIGARKSLVYRKSLDCVAGVLRGIRKSEKGRVKGREKRTPFFISASFPFTPLPSSLVFAPVTQTTTQAIVKPIYSLWHDCDLSAVLQGSGSPYTCGPILPG